MMEQVNFRLVKDEKDILVELAKARGILVAELAKTAVLKEISNTRVDLAFDLLTECKIGFKRAWGISGLSYHEFLNEWSKRGAAECINEAAEEKGLKTALTLNIQEFLKN